MPTAFCWVLVMPHTSDSKVLDLFRPPSPPTPAPTPRCGGMVLATSRKTQDKELPLGSYLPIARGVGVLEYFGFRSGLGNGVVSMNRGPAPEALYTIPGMPITRQGRFCGFFKAG